MTSELAAVVYGLASGIGFGTGDFIGGFATKRASALYVSLFARMTGAAIMTAMALLTAEAAPPAESLLWGMLVGIANTTGGLALYYGLSLGNMGVVAPVSALVTAIIPVIFGMMIEGLPTMQQGAGFLLALPAIWLISRSGSSGISSLSDLRYAVYAGTPFGFGFIFADRIADGALFWPLLAGGGAGIILLTTAIRFSTIHRQPPSLDQIPIIALGAMFSVGGTACFVLAAQSGRLDISSVLAALYPAATVLLARFILREYLSNRQWMGVAAALAAVVLIAG